jgi:hypothetical protein
MPIDWTLAIVVWIVCGIASGWISQTRGASSPVEWFVIGVIFGPLGVLLAILFAKPPAVPVAPVSAIPPALSAAAGQPGRYQCPHCSRPIDGSTPFCPHCGGRLSMAAQPSPGFVATTPTAAKAGPSRPTVVALVGVLLLVFVAAVGTTLVNSNAIVSGLREPTPTPLRPTLAPVGGSGHITFGTNYDATTLAVTDPRTTFARTYSPIAWSAEFSEAAGATTIKIIVASQTASGGERVLISEDVTLSNPGSDLIANEADLATLVGNAKGTYVMRYLRDATILAEGTFTLK